MAESSVTTSENNGSNNDGHASFKYYADAHFHLDRSADQKMGFNVNMTLEGVLYAAQEKYGLRDPPQCQLSLVVTNFCDPENFGQLSKRLNTILQDERLRVSFGIHPKIHLSQNKKVYLKQTVTANLRKFLNNQKTVAFGEVGLDFEKEVGRGWANQEFMLETLLNSVKDILKNRNLPVVLHLRGGHRAHYDQVASKAKGILTATVGCEHPIQLHCFLGSSEDVAKWLKDFPNCSFSIAVGKFQNMTYMSEEAKMLRSIPREKLLLETDAPHLSGQKGVISSPLNIPNRARIIANALDCSVDDLLKDTLQNAVNFFHL